MEGRELGVEEKRSDEQGSKIFSLSLSLPLLPPHPRLFEMLQKITGSGMKGCTVGGQERRRMEEEEKRQTQVDTAVRE